MSVSFYVKILETVDEIASVEQLQRIVWPGNEVDIVPGHLILTAAHNGGMVIGAYSKEVEKPPFILAEQKAFFPNQSSLIGFVFSFPGLYETELGTQIKHCSHMLAVHPDFRDHGIGFALKRAQWQMVRRQPVKLITWTYDPLQSRNANVNIARLGAVCNTYINDAYGEMRDGLNSGLPSDRFRIDWWINSWRVAKRLSKKPRLQLDLAHYLAANVPIVNPTKINTAGFPEPNSAGLIDDDQITPGNYPLLLLEIPSDIQDLKLKNMELAFAWRMHTRQLFWTLFDRGYMVTDFIYLRGPYPRSFYVLSNGEINL